MIVSILYLIYINRTLLKPFQQLQTFAANVARGNLDIPLNMDRNNYFGAFTESFDLLREELSVLVKESMNLTVVRKSLWPH